MSAVPSHLGSVQPSLRMTEEEFVRWADEDTHAEWVNGEVVLKMPISSEHDEIQFWLRSLVQSFVERRKLGKVRGPQFTIRLSQKPSRRDPDLIFVAKDRLHLMTRTYVNGAADLAMEVVSPDSVARDYREKFLEYQAAGVREYWIVDPLARSVELYVLGKDAAYEKAEAKDGKLLSTVLAGFWIRPDDPFKDPLPDVNQLLQEIST